MNRTHGALVVRGDAVPDTVVDALVDEITTALDRAGAGPGRPVSVAEQTGLVPVIATLAAARLGCPLVFQAGLRDDLPATAPAAVAQVRTGGDRHPVQVRVLPRLDSSTLPDDTAVVFSSSGTTGRPKAVLLSRSAVDYQALATRDRLAVGPDDEMLLPLPLHHAYGYSVLEIWRRFGPTLDVHTITDFDRVCRGLARPRVSMVDGVPSFYRVLLRRAQHDAEIRDRLRALRVRGCGGAVLSRRLRQDFQRCVGAPLHDGYGLTEAGPNVALTSPSLYREGTVGLPLAGTEVRADTTGELLVRGPGLMTEYHADPAGTSVAFTEDGWLRTGDLGEFDPDGFVRVVGRCKDVLIVHGETHSPQTVEDVLLEHAMVLDAVVIGVPTDAARGDVVIAFVEVAEPASVPDTATLRAACRVLPLVLRPTTVRVVARLPRLATGKLDRRAVRQMAQADVEAGWGGS